jgi:ligand-binding sensor domain-containing protein
MQEKIEKKFYGFTRNSKNWVFLPGLIRKASCPDKIGVKRFQRLSTNQILLNFGIKTSSIPAYNKSKYSYSHWELLNEKNSNLPNNNIKAILDDKNGGLWIDTSQGLVHYFRNEDWELFEVHYDWPGNHFKPLLCDNTGNLWLGLYKITKANKNVASSIEGRGLCVYKKDGSHKIFEAGRSKLPDNFINVIVQSESSPLLFGKGNSFWIGTNKGGLAFYHESDYWELFDIDNSPLPSNEIRDILNDGSGGIWIATSITPYAQTKGAGVAVWTGSAGIARYKINRAWKVFNKNNSKLPYVDVTNIRSDGKGGVWIVVTNSNGFSFSETFLVHYKSSKEWDIFSQENSKFPGVFIRAIVNDGNGGLWIGFFESGLTHYSNEGVWKTFNKINSKLPSNQINALLRDNNGKLWIGTDEGIVCVY